MFYRAIMDLFNDTINGEMDFRSYTWCSDSGKKLESDGSVYHQTHFYVILFLITHVITPSGGPFKWISHK